MTHHVLPDLHEIQGPFSQWPRQPRWSWGKRSLYAFSIVGLAVFVHCGILLLAA